MELGENQFFPTNTSVSSITSSSVFVVNNNATAGNSNATLMNDSIGGGQMFQSVNDVGRLEFKEEIWLNRSCRELDRVPFPSATWPASSHYT